MRSPACSLAFWQEPTEQLDNLIFATALDFEFSNDVDSQILEASEDGVQAFKDDQQTWLKLFISGKAGGMFLT